MLGDTQRSAATSRLRADSFARDESGNIALIFALGLPALLGAVGLGLDYASAASMRSKMQNVADSAATASAREFQMAKADAKKIAALARNYVSTQLQDVTITTKVDHSAYSVQVVLEKEVETLVGRALLHGKIHLKASATAKMTGGLPICLLGLDRKAKDTIRLEKNARMTAPACGVYSNSSNSEGLTSKDNAVLQAGFICSAGGKVRTRNTNYTPDPQTDCPVLPDPLSSRQPPAESACTHKKVVVDGGTMTLEPGVYCGGLTITNGAQVKLRSGIYTVKDGPLVVEKKGDLRGTNVAIYMKGKGANLNFAMASTISLTAPKEGPMSGILIFDDPSGAPAPERPGLLGALGALLHPKDDKSPREHKILSDNARTLLGTIYMPRGRLIIDATKPIADRSAYTVLVVEQLDLYDGPDLILNSDYSASDIPVPKGVGPYGGDVVLTK